MESLLTTGQISYEKNNVPIHIFFNQKPIHVTTNTLVVVYYRGHAVAYVVEALCYKPKGRGFVSLWYH